MSIEKTMAGYYADRAREYERIYQKPERQEELRQLRKFIEETFVGADVFELACGTGYWTESLAKVARSVVATDVNEEVLDVARSKGMDSRTVRFRREDAYALSMGSHQFGAGLSAFWWSHVPKRRLQDFLQGFHRLFSPGARVVFIDNCYAEGSSTPISRKDTEGNTYQLRHLDNGSTHEVLKNFPTETELHAAVGKLGKNVQVRFLRYFWILQYDVDGF